MSKKLEDLQQELVRNTEEGSTTDFQKNINDLTYKLDDIRKELA